MTLTGTHESPIHEPGPTVPDAAPAAPSNSMRSNPMSPMVPPAPRGPLSAALLRLLTRRRLASLDHVDAASTGMLARMTDPLADGDFQLSLFLLYELHYGGLEGVPDSWEWEPKLLEARRALERAFELALRGRVSPPTSERGVGVALDEIVGGVEPPLLASFIEHQATVEQVREVLACRSISALHEADAHSWTIPRLHDAPKAALVEILSERHGGGHAGRMHAATFARCLLAAGLDDRYGAYADHVPTAVFTSMNTMSLFGLHRRLRGASVGHLASFESTWALPHRACSNGLRRLGFGADATTYFDEHTESDPIREHLATHELAGALADAEPELADDILFGAAAGIFVDGRLWMGVLSRFRAGDSALLRPLAGARREGEGG